MNALTKNVRKELLMKQKTLNGKILSPQEWLNFAQDMISVVNSE